MKCNTKHKVLHILRNKFKLLAHPDGLCHLSGYYFGQFNEKEQSTTNKSMLQHVKSIAKEYNNIK